MEPPQLLTRRLRGFPDLDHLTAADLYRVGSSVLTRLPLYNRLRPSTTTEIPPCTGDITPPPAYCVSTEEPPLVASHPASPPPLLQTPQSPQQLSMDKPTGGYFPDTGTKRLLRSLLTGDTPTPSELLSNILSAPAPEPAPAECTCFDCFQQRQLYLLWLQQQQSGSHPHAHAHGLQYGPQHQYQYQQKTRLHRVTAALILQMFTLAFILYPYLKRILATAWSWERRNKVSSRVWGGMRWLCDGRVDEERVKRWVVDAGGEVLGGVVDGVRMGVGVWGGKGKGRAVG